MSTRKTFLHLPATNLPTNFIFLSITILKSLDCFTGRPLIVDWYYPECGQLASHRILLVVIRSIRKDWQKELIPLLGASNTIPVYVDFASTLYCYNFIELTSRIYAIMVGLGKRFSSKREDAHTTKRLTWLKTGTTLVKEIRSVPETENGAIINLRSLSRVTKNNSDPKTPCYSRLETRTN